MQHRHQGPAAFAPPRVRDQATNPDGRRAEALDRRSAMALHKPVPAEAALLGRTEAVSQTNGIGAKQQRLGEPLETHASGAVLRASAGSARLICLDADLCFWRSITNNFRSVTFVKRPRRQPEEMPATLEFSLHCGSD